MLEVLLFVVFDHSGEVVVQNCFVVLSSGSLEKENNFEFGRSGDRCLNPLAVYEEKPPIEDRNFTHQWRNLGRSDMYGNSYG